MVFGKPKMGKSYLCMDFAGCLARNHGKVVYVAKFVFQTTKEGKFRGANIFQHDVDVVIEVPEKGKAIQMGRFNQGGEIWIFDQNHNG
jgi:predicted ATP-dependent serine protease